MVLGYATHCFLRAPRRPARRPCRGDPSGGRDAGRLVQCGRVAGMPVAGVSDLPVRGAGRPRRRRCGHRGGIWPAQVWGHCRSLAPPSPAVWAARAPAGPGSRRPSHNLGPSRRAIRHHRSLRPRRSPARVVARPWPGPGRSCSPLAAPPRNKAFAPTIKHVRIITVSLLIVCRNDQLQAHCTNPRKH